MRPLLLPLLLLALAALAAAQAPPTLPNGFFADVRLTLSGLLPYVPSASLAYQLEGQVYYVPQQNKTVFYVADPLTNRRARQVITPTFVYEIDLPTGVCTQTTVASASQPYQQYLAPTFLKDMSFSFMANEYLLQGNAFFLTQHWQNAPTASTYMQYWHNMDSNVPFRLSWDLINPVIVEFSSVVSDLGAVPNLAWLTSVPASCSSAAAHKQGLRAAPQRVPAVAPAVSASGQNGTAWPQQWHATSAFTGNSLGLFTPAESVADVSDPTYVAFELQGDYYYDWPNQRECNTWTNILTGDLSKTLIVNATYYIVNLATMSCSIVPIAPVNGPLKFDWPTRIPYLEQQFLQSPGSYIRANHYQNDVLGIGLDHAFNYWSDTSGSPMQFQGPVLEFPPYGQSMMSWRQPVTGLDGVDLDTIFSLPNNCTHVGPTHPEYSFAMAHLRPMLTMHKAIARLYE